MYNEKSAHPDDDTDIEATASQAPCRSKLNTTSATQLPKAQAGDANISFPEGGFKAWLCVFGGWWCTFITFGYLNAYGIFQDYYQQTTLSHKSPSQISWIGAFQYFLMFAPAIFAGRLFDLGFFRPLFATGCALLVFLSDDGQPVHRLLPALPRAGRRTWSWFWASYSTSPSTAQHTTFNRRRGVDLGVVASGSSTGGIIFPIMVRKLIPQIGYGWTMRIVGFFALFAVTIAWFSLSPVCPPRSTCTTSPKGGWKQIQWTDFSAFRNPAYTFFCHRRQLNHVWPLHALLPTMDVWTSSHNIPANGYFLPILNAASSFGRVLPGLVADRVGRINTSAASGVSGILIFIFPPLHQPRRP